MGVSGVAAGERASRIVQDMGSIATDDSECLDARLPGLYPQRFPQHRDLT